MKPNHKTKAYGIAWLITLIIFNIIVFVVPALPGAEKYTTTFWVSYCAVMLAFVGQLACSFLALREEKKERLFYRIPLIRISYTGLIVMLVVGAVFLTVSALPDWLAVVVCVLILAVQAISVIKASAAAEEVERIDERVKEQTFFIKSLAVDANTLMAQCKTEAVKTEVKKVYEAIRYSDPVSNPALAGIENQISMKFTVLSQATAEGSEEAVKREAEDLLVLIGDRNQKCKLLK